MSTGFEIALLIGAAGAVTYIAVKYHRRTRIIALEFGWMFAVFFAAMELALWSTADATLPRQVAAVLSVGILWSIFAMPVGVRRIVRRLQEQKLI